MHRPRRPVYSPVFAAGHRVHQVPLSVQNLDFQIAENMPRPLVVGNEGFRRSTGAAERLVSLGPPAECFHPLYRGRPGRNPASSVISSGVSARNGEMLSTIQIPRPCVARIRSEVSGALRGRALLRPENASPYIVPSARHHPRRSTGRIPSPGTRDWSPPYLP